MNLLVPGGRDIVDHAEHDQIWLGVTLKELAAVAVPDDVRFLVSCGVFVDDDALSMFV